MKEVKVSVQCNNGRVSISTLSVVGENVCGSVTSRVYTESAEQIKSPVNLKEDSISTGLLIRSSLLWSAVVKGDELSP